MTAAISPPGGASHLREPRSPSDLASVWRAESLAVHEQVRASGHPALDAQLPGGGWPEGALVELLQDRPAQHLWQLLLPALVPALRDRPGQAHREVAGARPEVGDRHVGRQRQRGDHRVGLLPGVTRGVVELGRPLLRVREAVVAVTQAAAGTYRLTATNAAGTALSDPALLMVTAMVWMV